MASHGVALLFTDRHAYTATAAGSGDHADPARMIASDILGRHDFARDDLYPDKMERYQAEALAYRHVPPNALLAIGCVSEGVGPAIEVSVQAAGSALQVFVRRGSTGSGRGWPRSARRSARAASVRSRSRPWERAMAGWTGARSSGRSPMLWPISIATSSSMNRRGH
jgi:hypothetical protein